MQIFLEYKAIICKSLKTSKLIIFSFGSKFIAFLDTPCPLVSKNNPHPSANTDQDDWIYIMFSVGRSIVDSFDVVIPFSVFIE